MSDGSTPAPPRRTPRPILRTRRPTPRAQALGSIETRQAADRQPGPAGFAATVRWLCTAYGELRFVEHESIAE
jgi:hypothetical protein